METAKVFEIYLKEQSEFFVPKKEKEKINQNLLISKKASENSFYNGHKAKLFIIKSKIPKYDANFLKMINLKY